MPPWHEMNFQSKGLISCGISGNLERECIEETCDQHELFEVYDDENAPEILKYNQCNLFVNECEFLIGLLDYL